MPGTQRDIPFLEGKFETGDIPTQQDFYDLFASFVHYLQVKQVTGASQSDVMSQKAISDLFTALKDGVPTAGDTLNKLYNLITAMGRPRGGFDASSGAVPSPTGDNEAGDFWRITVAGTIGTMVLKAGDVLIASIDDAAVAADFYAIQGNVDQATDTVLGLLQIQNQAGSEDAATNATIGNIDHTKAITGRGLRWFWEKVKTLAQTITAIWTFAGLKVSGQIESGKKVFMFLDTDGTITKIPWHEVNTTDRTITKTGVNNLMTTILEEWKNSDGASIMQILNGLRVKFGGSAAIWEIDDAVASGNAEVAMVDNIAVALRFRNKTGDELLTARTSTGNMALVFREPVEFDFKMGFKKVHIQAFFLVETLTTSLWHNIFSIPLAADKSVQVTVNHLNAYAPDRSAAFAYGNMQGYARRDNANVVSGTNPSYTIQGDGITGVNWRIIANNVDKRLDIDFQNNSDTGLAWQIVLDFTYILRSLPS